MKHLKLYEQFSKQNVKNMLLKAQKDNKLVMRVSPETILTYLSDDMSKIGTFEGFVEDEGDFISAGDKQRMGEYIKKFKDLGLDTTKIEELFPFYKRYDAMYDDIEKIHHSYSSEYGGKEGKEIAMKKLYDEEDTLTPKVKEFETEIKALAKKANEL